jgi:hypothetical protein
MSGPRWGSALIAASALSLLVSACGGSSGSHVAQLGSSPTKTRSNPSSTTPTGPARRKQRLAELAFSRCMRAHGLRNFPDPNAQGMFPPLNQQALGVPKQQSLAVQNVCERLLSGGGSATPQQVRQKLAFGVKVALCLRTHGYPNFPDPTRLAPQSLPPGIDLNSPRFQAAEAACEQKERKALGLP